MKPAFINATITKLRGADAITREWLTESDYADDQIRLLHDGKEGLLDPAIKDLCRLALQNGIPTSKYPWCIHCGWRKGGGDSWDGARCKCGLSALPHFTCGVCHGMGTTPYGIGSQACGSCDGSGLIDPAARMMARVRIAEILSRNGLNVD